MRHYPNSLAGLPILEIYENCILAGFAAEEVEGVEVFILTGVVGADDHVGAVVDADDGLALVVAEVEAVDVVAVQDHCLTVNRRRLVFFGFGVL